MTAVLRPYAPFDCPELVRLFRETVHSVNARDYTPEQLDAWAPRAIDLAAWDRSLRAHRTLVAVEGAAIVGFGDIDVASGYLDRLFVHRERQGTGIARMLCDALEKGVAGPVTTRASVTARPFFEHRGYRVTGELRVVRCGVGLTAYAMELPAR